MDEDPYLTAAYDCCEHALENLSTAMSHVMSDEPDYPTVLLQLNRAYVHTGDALALAVRDAHAAGMSWAQIGQALGVSRQSAWERFSDHASVTDSLANADTRPLF